MASDIFAKIGDIKGESKDVKQKDEIEVLSFSWGVTNSASPGMGGGAGAGKPSFQDLSIVHTIDKASPRLLEACATGAHLKEATITHRKAGKGQLEYLIVKMNDVVITAVTHGGPAGQPAPETVSLAATRLVRRVAAGLSCRDRRPDPTAPRGLRPLLIHANGVDLRTRAFGARQLDRVRRPARVSGLQQHELRALEEFTREYALEWELVAASLLGREVAIRIRSNRRIRV